MPYSRPELLSGLLSILWFLRIQHQEVHWESSGTSFYGDHLLFQRLYETVDAELDVVAEKILGLDSPGVSCMGGVKGALLVAAQFEIFEQIQDPVERSLRAEKMFLQSIEKLYSLLEDSGQLTMGLDDMLQALASSHETHVYLLKQRCN